MLFPAITGLGGSVLVTAISAWAMTAVVVVEVAFSGVGSLVSAVAVAVLVIVVPPATVPGTLTTMVKTAVSPEGTEALVNTTLPVPPTEGAAVPQPLPVVTVAETNVVFAGTASVSETLTA